MRGPRFQLSCFHLKACVSKTVKKKSFLVLLCAFVVIFLYRWRFVCTNMQPLLHVQKLCSSFSKGLVVGNLCGHLCRTHSISSISCHNFYQEKEAVFSGTWKNTSIVFKSAKKIQNVEPLYWLDASRSKIYPSEGDFLEMIKSRVREKFNMNINEFDAKKVSYIHYNPKWPHRHTEMDNIWTLIQDNEYLALLLYENYEIFPKLVGTCGSLYAVQKLSTISGFWHLMTFYDSKAEWLKRVKVSIMILDFLVHLETELPEPLLICDVKINHFGVTNDFKRILYLDLDSVHPVSIANQITADGSRCTKHSDCDYMNCRSFCNLISKKCEHGVVNNNLQIVCERIFLGWVMSGRMMVPGLLMGPHAPHVLIEVLEICANPASERLTPRASASKDIRKRLHDLLVYLTY